MADGVLTSSLGQELVQDIFWHASFAEKQGAYVDNQFWLTSDTFEHSRVIQKDLVEKVVNMKVLCIFKVKNFVFGVILI